MTAAGSAVGAMTRHQGRPRGIVTILKAVRIRLNAYRLSADENLYVIGGMKFKDIALDGTNVSGRLDMSSSSFEGKLHAADLIVH
jgi:hypothetical protein